jgi:translation initiation factor 5B
MLFQASVIFGAVTIFAVLSWYFTPPEKWLRKEQVLQTMETANEPEEIYD